MTGDDGRHNVPAIRDEGRRTLSRRTYLWLIASMACLPLIPITSLMGRVTRSARDRRGERMRDRLGNEYMFCEFVTTNVSGGLLVGIDSKCRVVLLRSETTRLAGVAMRRQPAGTWGWVQVSGRVL